MPPKPEPAASATLPNPPADDDSDDIPAGLPATEIIERCLKYSLNNIASSVLRDNATLDHVIGKATGVYIGVLDLIQQIDEAPVTDPDISWAPFDAYTIAIPELERVLFDFCQRYTDKFRDFLPPIDRTDNGVLYVQTWKGDREFISKLVEHLKHNAFKGLSKELAVELEESLIDSREEDDKALLDKLSSFIGENRLDDGHIEKGGKVAFTVKGMKGDLKAIAEKLKKSKYDETVASVVIRTFMYFAIPCTLILSDKADGQWKIYLRKLTIWEAFNSLIVQVKAYLNAPKSTDEIETLFTEIEKLLLNLGDTDIATAAEILSLFKLAPMIYRQYHGRSVALIKTLYYLDSHSRKEENKSVATYRYDLKQVMTECIENLTALSKIKLDIANFSTEAVDYKAKAKEIEGLFDKTKNLFDSLQAATQLPRYVDLYSQAVSIDESHVKEAREKLFPSA